MKDTKKAIIGIIVFIAIIGMVVGNVCIFIAGVQEFGALGLFLHKGVFRLAMLWGQPLFMTGLAIGTTSATIIAAAKCAL